MLTIDAINDMLAWVGESPLDATDPDYTQHPLYESALRILNTTSRKVQAKGWWFNTRRRKLTPALGAVTIPDTYLTVTVLDGHITEYTIRDGSLYDLTNGTATITRSLTCLVRELIPFEDMPDTAAGYIAAAASTRFAKTYDGDRAKVKDVQEEESTAYAVFNADHIRNSRVNLYATNSMSPILANNWYSRYRQR